MVKFKVEIFSSVINLKIFEVFEKEQIEFAFPTRTLYVNKQNEPEAGENVAVKE